MHWIDPESLPESRHRIRQFLVTPDGDVDGFVSMEGQQVHVPPHLGNALTKSVNAGDLVHVRGVKPRYADVIAALLIESAHGSRVEDHGPPPTPSRGTKKPRRAAKRELQGDVERVLYASRGERVGLLLSSGVIVRFDPELADELEEFLIAGTRIFASGDLHTTKWGTVLDADYLWLPVDEDATASQSGTDES
jgi:hypothetical protein